MSDNFKKYVNYELYGEGKIILEDSEENTAYFQIYQLNQGNSVGVLSFTKTDSKLEDILKFEKIFRFDGKTVNGLKISAKGCAVYSYTFDIIDNSPKNARFLINVLKVSNINNLDNLEKQDITLCFEIGVLNYYSKPNFLVNTEIGDIQIINRLTDDDIDLFKNLHIPDNTSLLRLQVKSEKSFEAMKKKIFKVVNKILELLSFALITQIRWSYYSVFLNEFSASQFIYCESTTRFPSIPNPHYVIEEHRLEEFLNKSYNNYTDQVNTKYNFSLALKWYLDSNSLKYDVMKFVSASTSLESILHSFSKDKESDTFLPDEKFKILRKKIEPVIINEIENQMPSEDVNSMLNKISDINRRSYKKKTEALLNSLGIHEDVARGALKEIIPIRDKIIHSGEFVNSDDKRKAAKVYSALGSILTQVFLRILVPDDDTFYRQIGPLKFID